MGKYARHLDSVDPLGRQNRIKRGLEREIRQQAAAKRARFADIGDDYTMTPEGPLPTAPMPLPDGLTITAGTEVIKVVWSGSASDTIPTDFGRLAIHVSKFTGYTPTQGTEVATVSSPYGGSALYAADGGDTYYVRCAIASLRGDYGPFTDELAITPSVAADPELFEGHAFARSIAVATVSGAVDDETFAGTALPTGWTHTARNAFLPDVGAYVTSTSVPSGSDNGSALVLDLATTEGTATLGEYSDGTVTTRVTDAVDVELVTRFQHSTAPTSSEIVTIFLRQTGEPNAGNYDGVGLRITESRIVVMDGTSDVNDLGTVPTDLLPGAWYNLRARLVAGRLAVSVWADGAAEPGPSEFSVSVLSPGRVAVDYSVTDLYGPPAGLLTYFDTFNVETLSTGFTVYPDGTARMTRAEIDTMPTKLQAGQVAVTVAAANTRYTQAVTFAEPFNEVPEVMVTPYVTGVETADASATSITATGFTLNYYRTNVANMTVGWVAVAP